MSLVVDASVACKWFVDEERSAEAARLLAGTEGLVAPDLIIAEVSNVLWRKRRGGEIASAQATAAIEELPRFFDDLIPSARLVARAFVIAEALAHPVYDCFYVALAELVGAQLVTADTRLLGRLEGTRWARHAAVLGQTAG